MIKFDYLEPTTLKKTFSLLEKYGDDARVIAGGTSLLIMMRQRLLTPKVVISLARIPRFGRIAYDPKADCVSAPAPVIATSSCRRLSSATIPAARNFRKVAQPRIRNMGTVGGNLAGGDP
jgi:carbon-monoxide dehydrogenase medium subunit